MADERDELDDPVREAEIARKNRRLGLALVIFCVLIALTTSFLLWKYDYLPLQEQDLFRSN